MNITCSRKRRCANCPVKKECDIADITNGINIWEIYLKARANTIDECIETLYDTTPTTVDQTLDMKFVIALRVLKEEIQ